MSALTRLRTIVSGNEIARMVLSSATLVTLQVGGTATTFLYTLLMARMLSPAQVGIIWTIWSALFLMSVVTNLNIGNAAVREVVRARALGEDALASGFLTVSRRIIAVMALPAIALFLCGFLLFGPYKTDTQLAPIILAAITLPILGWMRTNAAVAATLDRGVAGQMSLNFARPLLVLVGLASLWALGIVPTVDAVLTLFLVAVLAAALLQHLLLMPSFGTVAATPPDTSRWRSWVGAGLILIPARTLADNLKNLFVFAAALGLADADTARFAIAFSLIVFLNFGLMAVEIVFNPKISAAIAKGDARRRDRLLLVSGALKLAPVALACAALTLLAAPILSIFGAAYVEAAPIVAWLCLMPLSRAFFGPAVMVLQVHERRGDIMAASLFGIVAIVAAVPLAGAASGLVAAAAAGSLAYVATQALTCGLCYWRTRVITIAPALLLSR